MSQVEAVTHLKGGEGGSGGSLEPPFKTKLFHFHGENIMLETYFARFFLFLSSDSSPKEMPRVRAVIRPMISLNVNIADCTC